MLRIILMTLFLALFTSSITTLSYAEPEAQIGFEVGKEIKYKVTISSKGYGEMDKLVEPLEIELERQFTEKYGFDIDKLIWIKYTVIDISGTVVTFDRTVKLASSERGEFEKKLEPVQFDLAEFEPMMFFVMPTDLIFGSMFAGTPAYGEITFASIDDTFRTGIKENVFVANKINTQIYRDKVVENTIEIDTLFTAYYYRQSGLLNSKTIDMNLTNLNTYNTGWVTIEIASIFDSSEYKDLKTTNKLKSINDRDDILERLSYLFVESLDSRYLITNGVESIGEPKKTTFEIINIKDESVLGALILYGNEEISRIISSTVYTGLRQTDTADDIHNHIRQALVPKCCDGLPTHSILLRDSRDADQAQAEVTIDDVKIRLNWIETDSAYKIGIFSQEITFLEENTEQDDMIEQRQEISTKSSDDLATDDGGGCLIATATYGTELASEIQNLREIRGKMYETESGGEVMHAVNNFYYSFSPTIADWERENIVFKETIRLLITPAMISFTILDHENIDSESALISYVLGIVALNIGMYFLTPAIIIMSVRKLV